MKKYFVLILSALVLFSCSKKEVPLDPSICGKILTKDVSKTTYYYNNYQSNTYYFTVEEYSINIDLSTGVKKIVITDSELMKANKSNYNKWQSLKVGDVYCK